MACCRAASRGRVSILPKGWQHIAFSVSSSVPTKPLEISRCYQELVKEIICGQLTLLLDEPLVFVMGTDPDPDEIPLVLHGQGSMMRPGPHGPELADLFEV